MFGMRKRVFILEQFIHTLIVLRVFTTHLFSTYLYIAIIILLLIGQHFKEGLTPKLVLLLAILHLQIFAEVNESIQLQYVAAIIGSVIHFLPLKFYWLPEPKKTVGFKQDSIQNGLHYVEFYPLDQSQPITGKSMKWNNHKQVAKMIQYTKISNKLLKKIGHLILTFVDKLRLKVGEGVEKNTGSSIAFCHGRGACPLFYSSYLMYMAGLGYRVGAVQHSEVQDTKLAHKQQIKQYREKEVQVRAAEFYQTIQKVQSENMVLVGHSYGCATIIQAYQSLEDQMKNKIKKLILLDPWFFPLSQKVFSKSIGCPVLILANQDFIKNPDMFERNSRFLKQQQSGKIEYVLWKSAHHNHQTDMGFIMGNLPKICKHSHMSQILYQLNIEAISRFIKGQKVEGAYGQKDLGRNYRPQVFYPQSNFQN